MSENQRERLNVLPDLTQVSLSATVPVAIHEFGVNMKKRNTAIFILTLLALAPSLGVLIPWINIFLPTAYCFIVPADGPPFSESVLPMFGGLSILLGLAALTRFAVSKYQSTRFLRFYAWIHILYSGLASLVWVLFFGSRFLNHFPITDIRFYLFFAFSLLPHVAWIYILRWVLRRLRPNQTTDNVDDPSPPVIIPEPKRHLAFLACPGIVLLTILVASSFKPKSPIHEAVAAGGVEAVTEMLRKDPSLVNKVPMHDGFEPLPTIAIKNDDMAMLKELLESGAKVDQLDEFDDTPLVAAIHAHNIPAMKLLLEHGANVNRDKGGYDNPLLEAARMGDSETLTILLDAGADLDTTYSAYRGMSKDVILTTPLKATAGRGDAMSVQLLIDRGAKVNQKAPNDDAAIHSSYSYIPVLKILLAAGANINEKGYLDQTPLHYAAKGQLLYDSRTQKNHYEATSTNVVAFLLANGADKDARDRAGLTPLQYAEKYGHAKIADMLRAAQYEQLKVSSEPLP